MGSVSLSSLFPANVKYEKNGLKEVFLWHVETATKWKVYNFFSRSKHRPPCGVRQTQTADLQTCRPADLQTCRLADLQTRRFADLHFLWQGFGLILFILCLLLANRKVCLRQTTALAGCKHNSARFDRWLEIFAVEDLKSEERWPKLQRKQRRRRRVGSSSGFIAEGHLWVGNKSAQNLIVGEFL